MIRFGRLFFTILCALALAVSVGLSAQTVPVEAPEPLPAETTAQPPQATPAPPARPAAPPPRPAPRTGAPASAAPAPAAAPAMPAGEAERLLRLLQDDARRAELVRTLQALTAAGGGAAVAPVQAAPAPAAPAPAPAETPAAAPSLAPDILAPNTLGAQLLQGASHRLSALSDQVVAAAQAIADLPSLLAWLSSMARDPVTQFRVMDASWKLLLVLGLGIVAEALASRALRRPRDWLEAQAPQNGGVLTLLRRLPLVVGRALLDLVPIGVFAVVSYGLIGAVRPLPTTELVLLLANNSYIGLRVIMASARMVLSPSSTQLRLVPLTDETSAYIVVWLRRVAMVLVIGYAVAEAGLQFGLPWNAYDSIRRVCFLLVTLFLVMMILQNRQTASDALRAPELGDGEVPDQARRLFRLVRDRLADIWHFLAIGWLIAAWGVWALEVEGGFWRLLRVSMLTMVVLAVAKLADFAMRRAIQGAFRITPDLARRYPGLETRANRYLPILKGSFSSVIGGVALLFLLESWGLDAFQWFGQGKLGNRLVGSLASIGFTLLVALAAWEAANAAIQRHLEKLSRDSKAARSARVRTLLPMLRTALMITIVIISGFIVLTEVGVNVAPLIAGAGVVGIAIGFGSQTLVRDIITGIFLLFEDALAVGDVVQVGGLSGVVEQLSIRSIKLRAIDGSLHIIPFSAVTTVTNMTRDFAFAVLDISVDYREDTDRVAEALRGVAAEMREDAKWRPVIRDDLDIMGVERLADSGVVIRIRLKTEPSQRWAVAREMNRRIKRRFDELGIEIPYPHQKLIMEKSEDRHPALPAPAAPGANE